MESYRQRTGERITYEKLAILTGLAKATLESLASRENYNPRLSTVERVCRALGATPGEILELGNEDDKDESADGP